MTINEACRAVPDADYHIMNDFAVYENLKEQRWKPTNGFIVTKGTDCRKAVVSSAWPSRGLFYFRDDKRIYKSTATSGSAIQVLAALGIRDVLMVGFDALDDPSGPEYAKSVGALPYWKGKGPPAEPRWRKVNVHLMDMIGRCGVTPTWWHRDMDAVRLARGALTLGGTR